jgi:hypothetical protein
MRVPPSPRSVARPELDPRPREARTANRAPHHDSSRHHGDTLSAAGRKLRAVLRPTGVLPEPVGGLEGHRREPQRGRRLGEGPVPRHEGVSGGEGVAGDHHVRRPRRAARPPQLRP